MKNRGLAFELGPLRAPLLGPASLVLLSLFLAVGCVNRGQQRPDGSSSAGGESGSGGHVTSGDANNDPRGAGGAGGAMCVADAGQLADAASCTSLMNFEGCTTYNASLNESSAQTGFKGVVSTGHAFCGGGALLITANVMPVVDAAETRKGELYLDVPGAPIDLGGKTVTFHVQADPPTPSVVSIYVLPISPTKGYGAFVKATANRPDWVSGSTSYAVGDLQVADVTKFSIQVSSVVDYAGLIYIDEIDVTTTPPDGGTGDGSTDAGDVRPPDVREGGTTDTASDGRDAPVGG